MIPTPCRVLADLRVQDRLETANEVRYELVKARAPISDLMAEAEDRIFQDFEFSDGLAYNPECVERLALWAAGCIDLLPLNYAINQKVLDEAWLSTYARTFVKAQYDGILENWIEDHWHDE